MFISHKSNVIQHIRETEWQCRRKSKGMSKPEYWAWIETITSDDDPPIITYPSEDFTVVECTDEDVQERLTQLSDYISNTLEGTTYNIKYYTSKRDVIDSDGNKIVDVEAHKDMNGKDVATTYVQSHFIGDNTAKDARLLADKWANVRRKRNQKLAETDYLALGDNTLSADMEKYRQELRDVPKDNSDPDNIDWPTEP